MHALRKKSGLTLVETLIYMALTSLILTGIILSLYPIFTNNDRIAESITRESESLFILRKIAWALQQAAHATVSGGNTLTGMTHAGDTFVFAPNGNFIELSLNGATAQPLNATRAPITNFSLINVPAEATLGTPRYIELSFKANGVLVGPLRYYVYF